MTTIFFEKFAEQLSGEELIHKLYRLETEPFETLYTQEEELFKWVAEQIDCSDWSELDWLIPWKTFLHSAFRELPEESTVSELKNKYAEILNTFFITNRLPLTERISVIVAARTVVRNRNLVLTI